MARKSSKAPGLQDNVDQGLVIVIIIGLLAGWLITAVKQNAEIELLQSRINTYETQNETLQNEVTDLRAKDSIE